MRLRLAIALNLSMMALLAAGDASAFCRSTTCRGECPTDDEGCPSTGQKLYWPATCIGFSIQKDGTESLDIKDVHVAIQKSFEAWAELDCGGKPATMTFSEIEDVSCKKSQYNPKKANVNVVLFQDNDWKYRGIDGTLAKTSVTYDDRTGEIFDADIEVNSAFNNLSTSETIINYDLRSIMTHEAGHFIGIAHSPDPNASMYSTYAQGSTGPRKVAEDDQAAVCAIYPPDRIGNCDVKPKNGLGTTCDGSTDPGCAFAIGEAPAGRTPLVLLGLLGVAVAVRRRRRVP